MSATPEIASRSAYTWRGVDDPGRIDHAVVRMGAESMSAHGTSTTSTYATSWDLDVGPGWVTRALRVSAHADGWSRALVLTRETDGTWSARTSVDGHCELVPPGLSDPRDIGGAIDCDLALSPVTDTMPIRRLGLLSGDVPATGLVMAWVEVPSLRVIRSDQSYASSGALVHYRSLTRGVAVDLDVDHHGIVVNYPGMARHVPQTASTSHEERDPRPAG
ncbi:putative glycolipid-binding domain-containing protein [Microbacterium wangchenii]|uniref:putative glycolipid-binding domain-containing protein n=1 Tax=Microbacterium wangchenii TaxID=2541726 RepID=UPI0011C9E800|nr:putative glycolipid-binding domain-containing protein [Microbacterium wangchenii]TXK15767.1 putative glycolipid-binding domain-containing protein [Microbacterium wangchenii]